MSGIGATLETIDGPTGSKHNPPERFCNCEAAANLYLQLDGQGWDLPYETVIYRRDAGCRHIRPLKFLDEVAIADDADAVAQIGLQI